MIAAFLVSALIAIVPYSSQPPMDGYPDPGGTHNVEANTDFTCVLKSKDEDTWQDNVTQQTYVYPSVSHGIEICAAHSGIHSGTPKSSSSSYSNGVFTLNQTIHAMTLSQNLQYYDEVDYYVSMDYNTNLLIKDGDCHFSHSVRINNPQYVPPGEGG